MKWLKKWNFLIILVAFGVVFLTYSGQWGYYADPLKRAAEWYREIQNSALPEGTQGDGADTASGGEAAGETAEESGSPAENEKQDVSAGDAEPEQSEIQEPEIQESESQEPEPALTWRDPSEIVYRTVEDDYFADAVFIGDSRTVGMFEYGGLEEISSFYASTGLTVYKLFDSPVVTVPGQREKETIEQALSERQFSAIYLMIGINEMGTGTVESFMEKYRGVLVHLQELQPDAVIYLQSIMKVTTNRSNQGDYINNEGIDVRNVEIAKLADNVRIYYLDVNPLICDESGGMEPSYTYDGVHLKAQYITIWKDYLKSHVVENLP